MKLYNYKCERCEIIIPSDKTREELMSEYKEDEMSIICNNCYDLIYPKNNPFNVAKEKMNASKLKE